MQCGQNPFQPLYESMTDKLMPFPQYIDVELTNYCNFECRMCPTGAGTLTREQGFMEESIFKKLAVAGIPLRFVRWGEPTLHPKFLKFLKLAKSCDLLTHVNTNGSLLTDEQVSLIDSLKFSFQGTDRDGYEAMRGQDFFNELYKLIKRICQKEQRPFVHVATTITDETPEQVEAFKEQFSFADLVTVGKTVPEYTGLDTPPPQIIRQCREPMNVLAVNWDGTVSVCCNDYDNEMLVGDLKVQSVQQIWVSEKMQYYREHGGRLCSFCYDYMGGE